MSLHVYRRFASSYASPRSAAATAAASIISPRSILCTRHHPFHLHNIQHSLINKPQPVGISFLLRSLHTSQYRLDNELRQDSTQQQQQQLPHHHHSQLSKEQLLAQSRHFLDRLKIRFKWALIRQNRPFNMDEISAFISWIVMGNLLWFIIGTTTFFGLIFYLFDKFMNNQSQRNKYLLKLIQFDTTNLKFDIDQNFAISYQDSRLIFENLKINNFKIKKIALTLSFTKWHEGKGLIKDLEINGLRGGVTHLDNHHNDIDFTHYFSKSYELENFVLTDSLIQAGSNIKLQIFHLQLDKLRNNWFFYDLFNSDNCTGAINDSLFTIHTKQTDRNYASFEELEKIVKMEDSNNNNKNESNIYLQLMDSVLNRKRPLNLETSSSSSSSQDKKRNDFRVENGYKKIIRFRVDQLKLDTLPKPKQFEWLKSGKMELIADIMFPDEDSPKLNYETRINQELKSIVTGLYDKLIDRPLAPTTNNDNELMMMNNNNTKRKYVMVDLKIQFKDLKCANTKNTRIDPDLIKFINYYNPDKIFELTSSDFDTLISSDDFGNDNNSGNGSGSDNNNSNSNNESDDDDLHDATSTLPMINFRVVENIQALNFDKFNFIVQHELINYMNFLKQENDARVRRYKDTSFLIKNLILVGLGVCFI